MVDGASLESHLRLESLLSQCVSTYDVLGDVDGSNVLDIVELVFADRGLDVKPAQEVVGPARLKDFGQAVLQRRPAALILTGIPTDGGSTGRTFAVLFCPRTIHAVDSHRHATEHGPQGWVWAQSPDWHEIWTWLFAPCGLLAQLSCRLDLVEAVVLDAAAVPGRRLPPGTLPSSMADPVAAVETAAVAEAAAQGAAARRACPHVEYVRRCARCRWEKHHDKFHRAALYIDATTSAEEVAVWPAPAPPGGAQAVFAIGCRLCARLARDVPAAVQHKRNRWHTFQVTGSAVTLDGLRKHWKTAMHQQALKAYAAPMNPARAGRATTEAEAAPARSAEEAAESVPRKSKFVDAISDCLSGHSGRGYAALQPKSDELSTPYLSTGVFRDESPHAYRKMVHSLAGVLDEEQADMLRRAVRIAFSDDDRDQHRILRIRVVWERPCVGYAEFFGALLKDFGTDTAACAAATLEGLKRMCMRREGGQLLGVQSVLDAELWDHVRQKVFCGATDGAAVALKGVGLLSDELPALRYQFRDRPHTTRTCVKVAFELCPESAEMRRRLITGPASFARRAKNSRRFREIWLRKQREDPNLFWNVCQDLGYAEQRYDSRSRPMSTFCEKLGPALQVLAEMSRDVLPHHRKDARWAAELLAALSGEAGFLKMVMFAIDTDFAVATHKLVRIQDVSQPDVALAAHEVQECVDVCRTLFQDGRIFDRAPNGTYTNRLLHGFAGVSQEILLGSGGSVVFGWPAAAEDAGYLREAVVHAKKLYKAVCLFFGYNFPHHAWRTRFEAFRLGTPMSQGHRRAHIQALAVKEGCDPVRAWQQIFEALPHVERAYKRLGDSRSAWAHYLDEFCRRPRPPHDWRPQADCVARLVLTYLGVMDGSSDVERNFSQMQLLECRRARRHHKEHVLQDLLKVRLHVPDAFRDRVLGAALCPTEEAFLHRAQMKYAEYFGCRRLASRSTIRVDASVKKALFALRRPRWQHLGLKKHSDRTKAARQRLWDEDVKRMVGERRLAVPADAVPADASFAPHADVNPDTLLQKEARRMEVLRVQAQIAHRESEALGYLAPPPPPVPKKSLMQAAEPRSKRKAHLWGRPRSEVQTARLEELKAKRPRAAASAGPSMQSRPSASPPAQGLPSPTKTVQGLPSPPFFQNFEPLAKQPTKPPSTVESPAKPRRSKTVRGYAAALACIRIAATARIHLSPTVAAKHPAVAAVLLKRGLLCLAAAEATHRVVATSPADRKRISESTPAIGARSYSLPKLLEALRAAAA
jgi:hypothetical protein